MGPTTYAIDDGENWGDPPQDEATVTLTDVAPAPTSFTYTYDFGDNWDYLVAVESIDPVEPGVRYPRCIAGRRTAPPEDCGVPGYLDLIDALADPAHPRHDELREWIGGEFDPAFFEVDQVNAAVGVWQEAQNS